MYFRPGSPPAVFPVRYVLYFNFFPSVSVLLGCLDDYSSEVWWTEQYVVLMDYLSVQPRVLFLIV